MRIFYSESTNKHTSFLRGGERPLPQLLSDFFNRGNILIRACYEGVSKSSRTES
jgi:hypothetical protein